MFVYKLLTNELFVYFYFKTAISTNRIKIFQDKAGVFHCSSSNVNPMPINPDIVRQEVQVLKSDFNGRLKQVLFNAMVCKNRFG